jgi:hypothetical protein
MYQTLADAFRVKWDGSSRIEFEKFIGLFDLRLSSLPPLPFISFHYDHLHYDHPLYHSNSDPYIQACSRYVSDLLIYPLMGV